MKYSLSDAAGNLAAPAAFSSGEASGKSILNGMKEIAARYPNVRGIAVSAPGFVDPDTGYLSNGGAITAFHGFQLKEYIEAFSGIPASVENDVNCAALAEKWKGNAMHDRDFLCMTIGTGIGGALFLNGELYRGHSNRAGEFGYMITNGTSVNTPHESTLSRMSSICSLRTHYAKMTGKAFENVSGLDVFAAYEAGDPAAAGLVRHFLLNIATGLYNLIYCLNPKKILIGGAVSNRTALIRELWEQLHYLGLTEADVELDTCLYKNHAGMIGALYHHLHGTGKEEDKNRAGSGAHSLPNHQ